MLKAFSFFFAHLYTSDPNTDGSNDLQVVQDEILQFSDATTLNEKQRVSSCCISWCGSVAGVSLQTMLCIQFGCDGCSFFCYAHATPPLCWHLETWEKYRWSPPHLHPPTPFTHSPPPCRCWMGGLLYRTCWWWSYSSCQAPSCLLHQSEYRRSQPSQLNCCFHSTWTDGGDGGKTLHWQQESIKDSDKHPWKNWFILITNN